MPDKQQTLVVIKPDGLAKSLTGNIITRLSEAKLRIIAAKVLIVPREMAEKHYEHLKGQKFFNSVIEYMCGELHGDKHSRVLAMVYQGIDSIAKVRALAGATNPELADPTSIRGQYGRITTTGIFENVLHCSDSPESAEKEIKLWFEPKEILENLYPVEKITVQIEKTVWK